LTLFFQTLGSTIFLAVAQTTLLSKLVPQLRIINPSITMQQIISAGATGVRKLFSESEIPAFLAAYANSLSAAFILSGVLAGIAVIVSFGMERVSLNRQQKPPPVPPKDSAILP
jgi:hypothetical protein